MFLLNLEELMIKLEEPFWTQKMNPWSSHLRQYDSSAHGATWSSATHNDAPSLRLPPQPWALTFFRVSLLLGTPGSFVKIQYEV